MSEYCANCKILADLNINQAKTITELKARENRTKIAVFEMWNDYQKGDFDLSRLAHLDLQSIVGTMTPTGEK